MLLSFETHKEYEQINQSEANKMKKYLIIKKAL